MQLVLNILINLTVLGVFLLWMFGRHYFYDYTFGTDGVRITLFKHFTLYHIPASRIQSVEVVDFCRFYRVREFGKLFCMSLGNRFTWYSLELKVRDGAWWYLSPKDAHAAAAALELPKLGAVEVDASLCSPK